MSEIKVSVGSEALAALLKRAQDGDESCLPELRAVLADGARGERLIERFGSPATWLENELKDQAAGKSLNVKEAVAQKLAKLRADLAGPTPTPIERLLAERAAVCWFLVNLYESIYANAKELSLRQADYQQSKIDRAHKRFLSALKTLATVRKLALPAIQVNIAEQQVNMAGPSGPRP